MIIVSLTEKIMSDFVNAFEDGFGDLFGLPTPASKKKTVKKEEKKETKSKAGTKKKNGKNEEKYDMPVTVYSEYGEFTVSEEGKQLTISEIEKLLPISLSVEKKKEFFIGFYDSFDKPINKEENITGTLYGAGNEAINVSCGVVKNHLVGSSEIYQSGDSYVMRFKEDRASNWNLKINGNYSIGFIGRWETIENEGEILIKKAVDNFIERYNWLKEVEVYYVFEEIEGRNIITVQYSKTKVSSQKITVKLPCKIRFLHDAGPLSDGLNPEMFDGKEYVSSSDILKLVDKYFPNIYTSENSTVEYVDSVNTVCVMKIGRKKGSSVKTKVADFVINKDGKLEYTQKIPKIPFSVMNDVYTFFKEQLPTEAIVQIVYDCETREYSCHYPESDKSLCAVSWSDRNIIKSKSESQVIVMEIHSHNTMPAFFSSTDDNDETLPMLYGVMGRLDDEHGQFKVRAGFGGSFQDKTVQEIFELPLLCYNGSTPFVKLYEDTNRGFYRNIKSGIFVIATGVKYYPNGTITWDYGDYMSCSLLELDLNEVEECLTKNLKSDKVVIRELLEKEVSLTEDLEIEDIEEIWNSGDAVLDSDNFKEKYFIKKI